ncbi:MAG TPA: EF-hand domain-containing protein [Phenylobacterium sp.]|nr:EF-hand domain-containing protein [Phenylobacterium sp.]
MRMRSWAGVVALALTVTACAEPEGPPVRNGHVRFDRPGETSVGFPDEEGGGPRRPREQLFISPSGKPFRAPMGQAYPVAAWFAEADANHDGRITLEEFRADADAWFKVLDTNGDGQISMPEVTHWEEVLVPEIARDASGLGGGFGGGGRGGRGAPSRNELDTRRQGAAAYSLVNEPHPIRGADSDFDLSVSRAEWRAAADRRFALLDADHDGAITLAELKPTPAQRGAAAQKDSGQGPGSPQGQGPQRQRRR